MGVSDGVLIAIPARGGSKRLPRKNAAELAGQPMLAYTIRAALESGLSSDVFVCTEDDEIAGVAERYGARVHSIPESMAGDEVSSTVPCLSLRADLARLGREFRYMFNLQPTSPLRSAQDLRDSMQRIEESGASFLVSVTAIDPHYFHWAMVPDTSTWRMYFRDEFLRERTQLPPVFRPNGAIKLARTAALIERNNFFGEPLVVHTMPEERSIHVATDFDLRCAEAMLTAAYHA
ncbi:MAG: acylneuraminate cytidylyltransferase family protein [Gemmatimonadetes bacterium]|nr:acylneuraminate cytidylyltransferase family protein [Gemmatimonadota bacterium]